LSVLPEKENIVNFFKYFRNISRNIRILLFQKVRENAVCSLSCVAVTSFG